MHATMTGMFKTKVGVNTSPEQQKFDIANPKCLKLNMNYEEVVCDGNASIFTLINSKIV